MAADAAAPYCDNGGAYSCNRDSSCYDTQLRSTICTGGSFGAFTCGSCFAGRQDCTGDVTCEVVTGTTNYPTGSNNNYGAACSAQCDSGYQDCDASGEGAGNGCEVQTNVTNLPVGLNNNYGAACSAQCDSGYQDCDASGIGAGNGCEVQTNVTDLLGGANNHYGAACSDQCDTNYLDCDAGGIGVGNGCEVLDNAVCGTNATVNGCSAGGANCMCDANYYDCDASGTNAGSGCEVLDGGACTVGSLSGTWSCSANAGGTCSNGGSNYDCTCDVASLYFETGVNTEYSTANPLLWGTQHGSGDLIQFGNSSTADLFSVNNDGALELAQITAPGTTTNKLYNVAGGLYFNGTLIGGATGHIQNTDTGTNSADFNINNAADTDSSITFGQTLGAVFSYVTANNWFNFNDDVNIQGDLTTTGTINNVTVGNTNQSIVFEPEYNNASYITTGANQGKLEIGYIDNDGAGGNNNYNFYKWTTQQAGMQESQIIIRYKIPEGFNSWQATPIQFLYRTEDATANHKLDIEIEDSTGTTVALTGANNLVSAGWASANITFGGVPTWTAGDEITIKIKLSANSSGVAYAGQLLLNWNGF